jgi:hypothetical protein
MQPNNLLCNESQLSEYLPKNSLHFLGPIDTCAVLTICLPPHMLGTLLPVKRLTGEIEQARISLMVCPPAYPKRGQDPCVSFAG